MFYYYAMLLQQRFSLNNLEIRWNIEVLFFLRLGTFPSEFLPIIIYIMQGFRFPVQNRSIENYNFVLCIFTIVIKSWLGNVPTILKQRKRDCHQVDRQKCIGRLLISSHLSGALTKVRLINFGISWNMRVLSFEDGVREVRKGGKGSEAWHLGYHP